MRTRLAMFVEGGSQCLHIGPAIPLPKLWFLDLLSDFLPTAQLPRSLAGVRGGVAHLGLSGVLAWLVSVQSYRNPASDNLRSGMGAQCLC